MQTRLIEDVEGLRAIAPAWRELLERAAYAEPVSTPLWTLAWWRQFGEADRRALRVLAAFEGDKLVALLPLSIRTVLHRRVLPIRTLELLGSGEAEADEICSDYVGIVCERGRESEVASELARALTSGALGAWDALVMPQMNGDDALVEALRGALEEKGVRTGLTRSGTCLHIPLPKTFDAYLKALESSQRYVVTRAMRELEKYAGKGGYTLRRAKDAAELEEGKRILRTLHGERWEDKGKAGVFASERFSRFHDEVMPKLLAGEDGALDLLWLEVKGEPLAVVYNIVYRGKIYFYQSGRKIDVPKALKPGIAIHALAIKQAIDEGRREYDFLNGASQYKQKLALAERPLMTLTAVASGVRPQVIAAMRALIERAVARVRAIRAARRAKAAGSAPRNEKAGEQQPAEVPGPAGPAG